MALLWVLLRSIGARIFYDRLHFDDGARLSSLRLRLSSPPVSKFVLTFFLVVGILAGHLCFRYLERRRVDLVVDARVASGKRFDVFVNENWESPLSLEIHPGIRHRYAFNNIPGIITHLRLDPTDVANAEIALFGVEFQRQGKTLLRFDSHEIGSWMSHDVIFRKTDGENVTLMTSVGDDPILENRSLNVAFSSGIFRKLIKAGEAGSRADFLVFILIGAGYFLFLNSAISVWKSTYVLALMAGSYFVAWLLCLIGIEVGGNLPAVSVTVGLASYTGVMKGAELGAFWSAVLGSGLVMACGAYCWRGIERRFSLGATAEPQSATRTGNVSLWFVFGVLSGYALLTFPHLRELFQNSGGYIHPNDYDWQNVITWDYFRHLGLVPFRDFWYCYGGFYYMSSPFPPDLLLRWGHRVLTFGVCTVSCYAILKYSKSRIIAILLFMLWLILVPFGASDRYFLSVALVVLFFLCLKMRTIFLFIIWGLYTFYVFFMEAVQLIYAAPACFFLLLVAVYREKQIDCKWTLVRRSTAGFFVAIVCMALYLMYLAKQGAFAGYIEFHKTMGDMAIYGMLPTAMVEWFRQPSSLGGLYWSMTCVLFFLSVWNLLSRGQSLRSLEDFLPFAVALLSLMIFQKQMIRPHMASQGLGVPAVGLALLAGRAEFRRVRGGMPTKIVLSVLVGLAVMVLVVEKGFSRMVWQRYLSQSISLPADVEMAMKGPGIWAPVAESYFAPERFSIDGKNGTELRDALLEKVKFEKKDDLFVLGDDSYLYVILQQRAPYYITFYNQSMLPSQQNTVAWLEKHKPKYVLWRDSFKEFDGVPNIVRVPLVFERVILDYAYADRVGPFVVLQRRNSQQAVAIDFWRTHLGETVDMVYIPSRSEPDKFADPGDSPSNHLTFLAAHVDNPVQGKEREILCEVVGQTYKIRFRERNGVTAYHILLNRIWFWQAAAKLGLETKLSLGEAEGISMRERKVALSRQILY